MKNTLKLLALAIMLGFGGCISQPAEGPNHLALGSPLPEFTISGPDGSIESPEYFAGKRTLIVLFRTTCEDCIREMPKVQSAWEEFGADADFTLAAISEESSQAVAAYWRASGYTMPYYVDTDGSVFAKFEISRVPTLYLFGTDGKVSYAAVEDAEGLSKLIGELQ